MLGKLIIQSTKVITVIVLITIYSCQPESLGYSNIPTISLQTVEVLKDINQKDSVIQLVVGFQDGDGDLGLEATDTTAPYNVGSPYAHNFPITFMVDNGSGEYEELINERTGKPYGNNHERIPVITPTGKYKAISGDITIKVTANPAAQNPTKVFLEMQLIDRALNVSNKIRTEVIELTH